MNISWPLPQSPACPTFCMRHVEFPVSDLLLIDSHWNTAHKKLPMRMKVLAETAKYYAKVEIKQSFLF